jgi:GntR family transcriptional regulator, transcriptional repressor for pyruvate dehydrogenase complex
MPTARHSPDADPPAPSPADAESQPAAPQAPKVVSPGPAMASPGAPPDGQLVAASFTPLHRNPRLSDKLAELLLESVKSGHLPTGSRLPSERELGEQFGVSRTVIREAVRSLAAKGVLVVRPGSGVHVATVEAASVSEQMSLFLSGRGAIEYRKINEVRTALEIQTARLAAERATEADVAELHGRCARMAALEDSEAASIEDVEFHRAVAHATHNELFVVMLDSIGDILLEIRRVTLAKPGRIRAGVAYHERILERIAAHDVEGADRAMREHLDDSIEAWRQAVAEPPPVPARGVE